MVGKIKNGVKLGEKEVLTNAEKIEFVICAIIYILCRFLKKNGKTIANKCGTLFIGATIPFYIWGIWSYINIVSNNLFTPELISKYNLFVVMVDSFH